MSLRSKILIILFFVLCLYASLDYGIQRLVIFPSFITLERDEAKKDMERCVEALRREVHHLDALANDWAAWDDTYEFVQDGNKDYIESNLVLESFTDTDLNIIYICNAKGYVVWGEVRDLETEKTIQIREFPKRSLPETHPLLQHETVDSSIAGIFMTEHGPVLVASRPIITSENKGPILGSLIMGRFLGEDVVETLVEQTRVNFRIWPVTTGSIPADKTGVLNHITDDDPLLISKLSNDLLQIYTTFSDIQGSPALLMQADIPRDISAKGATAMRFALVSILVVGIIVLIVLLLLLQQTVVGPIKRLTDHAVAVGKSDDLSARLALQRSDEIGTLAREFDSMVEQLSEARKKLLEQSYHSGVAEMASGVLHNIRNALSPIIGEIGVLRQDLQKAPVKKLEMAQQELAQGNPDPQRREDLTQFSALASQSLARLVREMKGRLDNIVGQASQVETILADQEMFTRAKRPVEKLKLDELVCDSLRFLPDNLRDGISVETDPSLAEMGLVMAHRAPLLQVFFNILGNAAESIRRANPGRGKIHIQAKAEQANGAEMIHVRIRDNGDGIEHTNLDRVFQRDFTTKQQGVSGTGLHWCANTISAMNGRLYAESEGIGHGACFHLLLPVNK
jgi:sensor domain CHASE-containing protein/nitrogen-specific signal transduction histidine kinase